MSIVDQPTVGPLLVGRNNVYMIDLNPDLGK